MNYLNGGPRKDTNPCAGSTMQHKREQRVENAAQSVGSRPCPFMMETARNVPDVRSKSTVFYGR